MPRVRTRLWFAAAILLIACVDSGPDGPSAADIEPTFTREQLLDPATCRGCHPVHYREWASSMHAYAADDPVFLAFNARGQRETGGELGDFCVKCHAPMALEEGATEDGTNMDEVPQHLKGVTCYFCHNTEAVEGTHNNPLVLANDRAMRGGLDNPVATTAHQSVYSELLDGSNSRSADMCGACHDIVNGNGVHMERTYSEWQASLFNSDEPQVLQTCGACHMTGLDGQVIAEESGVETPPRRRHEHLFPGVDLALTEWPEIDRQRAAIDCDLLPVARAELCVLPSNEVIVTLETNIGHAWPSGATQDRRAWVELVATRDDGPLFESGVIAEGEWVDKPRMAEDYDPNLWQLRDRLYNAQAEPTHMFWEAAPSTEYPEGYDGQLLPPPPPDVLVGHTLERNYVLPGPPDEVRMALHIRPMGLDVIDDLIESGDLEDETLRDRIETFTPALSVLRWTAEDGPGCVTRAQPAPFACPEHYRDMPAP